MDRSAILASVELFEGLTAGELNDISNICHEKTFRQGEVITEQGEPGEELYIVYDGIVDVIRQGTSPDESPRTVVSLGIGQIFGEMALVDHGPRSATIQAASDNTSVLIIHRDEFDRQCEANHHLGYTVMRNVAADLSFKLRHRHLTGR